MPQIDLVTHGEHGTAGPWALAARPGDKLHFNRHEEMYASHEDVDWHLLIGDETALPANCVALEIMGEGAGEDVHLKIGALKTKPSWIIPKT